MSVIYTVHAPAYLKAVFHAAKYPSSSVYGLLVGTSEKLEGGSAKVEVEDAVLVLHHWTALGVAAEAALGMVRSLPSCSTAPSLTQLTRERRLMSMPSRKARSWSESTRPTPTWIAGSCRRPHCRCSRRYEEPDARKRLGWWYVGDSSVKSGLTTVN